MTESVEPHNEGKPRKVLVLKLKGTRKQSITWAADTVNNENMGKKSSKREHLACELVSDDWAELDLCLNP